MTPTHPPSRQDEPDHGTPGAVLDWGWRYDLMVWSLDLMLGGKLRAVRRLALDLAELGPGAAVLDVGCGTGTLAVEAYRRVGQTGRVAGIDPAPRQLARARAKAARHGARVDFQVGVVERLPFPDACFDAVLSTWMMHHLPDEVKRQGLSEIVRVLEPGGCLVVVDSEHPGRHGFRGMHGRGGGARFGAGELSAEDQPTLMKEAGLTQIETRQMRFAWIPGFPRAGFTLGRKPPAEPASATSPLS
jgi:ubiquinone/menaquinone biosynthesis C-methylase UbiE